MTAPEFSFVVPGNPLSLNHAYPTGRGGRRFKSHEGKRWAQAVGLLAAASRRGRPPIDGPVAVTLYLYFSSRRPDLDNAVKPILDALAGVLYLNDRQVTELTATKGLDPKNPRAEVRVWGLDE